MASYYKGLQFNTALQAQWAAFFDLARWSWWTNPRAIENWKSDFLVTFPCGHSECGESHTLLVTVLPVPTVEEINSFAGLAHSYHVDDADGEWVADASALFGSNPETATWEMSHGSGGGVEKLSDWVDEADDFWKKAATLIK